MLCTEEEYDAMKAEFEIRIIGQHKEKYQYHRNYQALYEKLNELLEDHDKLQAVYAEDQNELRRLMNVLRRLNQEIKDLKKELVEQMKSIREIEMSHNDEIKALHSLYRDSMPLH